MDEISFFLICASSFNYIYWKWKRRKKPDEIYVEAFLDMKGRDLIRERYKEIERGVKRGGDREQRVRRDFSLFKLVFMELLMIS